MIALADRAKFAPVIAGIAEGYRPPPRLTVSQWAAQHRFMSSRESRYPGLWSNDVVPPMADIMDCLSEHHPARRVVLKKSAQIAGTECGLNFLGYVIHLTPGPFLFVQPTVDMAKRLSRQRIASMIQACPQLRSRVAPVRSRDGGNSLLQKEFDGGLLVMAGANSAAGLRSMPARFLDLDEVEAYPLDVDGEGDPSELAEARTQFYEGEEKVLVTSTPTIPEGKIVREYNAGDQRQCWVPCLDCREFQVLVWEQVKWDTSEPDPLTRHRSAAYVCPHCGSPWTDAMRARSVRQYQWKERRAFNGTASFEIWTAYNTHASLARVVAKYEKALAGKLAAEAAAAAAGEAADEEDGDAEDDVEESLQVFFNTVVGQPRERGRASVDATGLLARREPYEAEPLPWRVLVITAGVDVHPDRLEMEVVGWGLGKESWSLEYHVLFGEPTQSEVWQELDRHLLRTYAHPSGRSLKIEAACIDTGGETTTQDAYDFCRDPARWARKVWAVKGDGGRRPIIAAPKRIQNRAGKEVKLFIVGTDIIKSRLARWLAIQRPEPEEGQPGADVSIPGFCHFSFAWDEAAFRQLTAERARTIYIRGVPRVVWEKPKRSRNERLDCRGYAIAALTGLNPSLAQRHAMTEKLMEEVRARAADLNAPPPMESNRARLLSKLKIT